MRFILLTALIGASVLPAQNISSALSGTVHDHSGGPIANASITVTGVDNGFVRTAVTNRDGFFSLPDLTPATFTITVATPGFKTWRQEKLTLASSEQRDLGEITLALGQVNETVTVVAES